MILDKNHENFYVIELKNQALRSIFNSDHNLRFFLAASNEFSDDIETINETDKVIKKLTSDLGLKDLLVVERFNPEHFPGLDSSFHIVVDPDEQLDTMPNVSKTIIITKYNEPQIQARSISKSDGITRTLQ